MVIRLSVIQRNPGNAVDLRASCLHYRDFAPQFRLELVIAEMQNGIAARLRTRDLQRYLDSLGARHCAQDRSTIERHQAGQLFDQGMSMGIVDVQPVWIRSSDCRWIA